MLSILAVRTRDGHSTLFSVTPSWRIVKSLASSVNDRRKATRSTLSALRANPPITGLLPRRSRPVRASAKDGLRSTPIAMAKVSSDSPPALRLDVRQGAQRGDDRGNGDVAEGTRCVHDGKFIRQNTARTGC
jgi:hypothetical protein